MPPRLQPPADVAEGWKPVSTAGTTGLQVSGGGVGGQPNLSGASVGAGNGDQGLGTPGERATVMAQDGWLQGRKESS